MEASVANEVKGHASNGFFPAPLGGAFLSMHGALASTNHRLVEQDLGRMTMMEGLFMEVVWIVIQHPSNALCPIMEDRFQFGPQSFIQKPLTAIKTIGWPSELLS
jgi:hypothetical protein